MNTCTCIPQPNENRGWACKKRFSRVPVHFLDIRSPSSTLLHHSIHCLPTNLPPRPVTPPVRARWATPYLLAVSIPVAGPPNTGQDSYHWSGQTVLKILWHWRNRLEQLNSIPMDLHPNANDHPPPGHESWKWATTNEDCSCRHNWSPIC